MSEKKLFSLSTTTNLIKYLQLKAPKVKNPLTSSSSSAQISIFFSPKPESEEKEMAFRPKVAVFLTALVAVSLLQQPRNVVAADFLSPLLSPVLNGLCNAVDCGKGICRVSGNHTFGFVCDCNSGWNQFHGGNHFSFLPCVVPNCSLSSSCFKHSPAPAPAPALASAPFPEPPGNRSLFDPCTWSYCGGGDCFQTSTFEHRCGCKQGYSNLLNVSSFPCYQDCSIGADCVSLGISISNSSSAPSSSTNLNDSGNNGNSFKRDLQVIMLMVISLLVILITDI